MWVLTNFGFFSIVEKPSDRLSGTLTIRGRVRADLEALKSKFLPTMGTIVSDGGTDYKYRATVGREELATAMGQIVSAIDYSNFKNSVAVAQGSERAHTYSEVWGTLNTLEDDVQLPAPRSRNKSGKSIAYGGVLFDESGNVLLRSPKNGFGGDRWTFPKGRPNGNESPEEAAIREVREETGYKAVIVCEILGEFAGDFTINRYFVMNAVGEPGSFDHETEEVRWVAPKVAVTLIDHRENRKRVRDLAVLKEAIAARELTFHKLDL